MMFRSRTTWLLATVVAAFTSSDVLAGNVLSNDSTGDPLRTAMQKIMTAVNGLGSCFNGPSAPSSLMTYQCWWNAATNPPTLLCYDGTSWDAAGTLNTSTHSFQPNLPAGAASANIGSLGADLTGTLPNPTIAALAVTNAKMAAGAAAANVGALAGDLIGTLPTPTIAKIQGTAVSGTTGTGNAVLSNGPVFSDHPRSLQSFGVVGNGVADDTAALSTALNSGQRLNCQATMKVTSLITVTNVNVALIAEAGSDCKINLTTSTASLYFTENPVNTVRLWNLSIAPMAALTSTGSPNPAAIDIEYPSGGVGNGPATSVDLKNIFIQPDAGGHYATSGIYLYNTNVTALDNILVVGDSGTFRSGTNGIVYDTNNSGSTFVAHHLFFSYVGDGVYFPQHATHGFQGARLYDIDCVYCNYGIVAFGGLDGLSDLLLVSGAEGAVTTAGVSIDNVNHVEILNNYWFLVNSPLTSPRTPANPLCYGLAWTIAVPTNGATNTLPSGSTCDGAQMTSFTGSRIGVNLSGVSNTNMASSVGTETLTNLDVGVQIQASTAGWVIAKQATKSVTTELANGGAAGANTLVPPLAVADGSAQAAGLVGEVIGSNIPVGSAVSLITGTPKTVTSVSLTAGDWDCRGDVAFNPAGTTTITLVAGATSTTNNTLPAQGTNGLFFLDTSFATGVGVSDSVSATQFNVSTTTSVYLIAESTFGVSTMSAFGNITCRRMR
jgi:hypothetical protein